MIKSHQVFTPTGIPVHSYVTRDSEDYEGRLRRALEIQNSIVSLSGPSKSGKTVLLRRVVDPNDLIEVTGATIRSPEDLWHSVLYRRGTAIPEGETTSVEGSFSVAGKGGGKMGIPLIAEGQMEASASGAGAVARSITKRAPTDILHLVAQEIAKSKFTIFIDDFHYIPREQQTEVAKQVKAASERGIRIVLASVPHRSDDAVRANPELRGRVEAIDIRYWKESELKEIAILGFRVLKVAMEESALRSMAVEAYGSPQLMQAICLQACVRMRVDADSGEANRRVAVHQDDMQAILQRTTSRANFRSLLEALHAGPRQRGTERKEFQLSDQSVGDVYRTILLALREGEGALSLTYDRLLERVRAVCSGEYPVGSSIQTSLEHMSKIAADERYRPAVLEWNEDKLDIVDPYFLFYLRHGSGLANLKA